MKPTPNNHKLSPRDDSVSLGKLLLKLRPHWPIFVICVILGLTIANLVNKVKQPVYHVNSTMLIQENRNIIPFSQDREMATRRSVDNVHNETAILESFSLIDSALNKMHVEVTYYEAGRIFGSSLRKEIYLDAPFRVSFDRDHPQPYKEIFTLNIIDEDWYYLSGIKGLEGLSENKQYLFGQKVEGESHSFTISRVAPYNKEVHDNKSYEFFLNNPSGLSETYKRNLIITPLSLNSNIFDISFESTNLQRGIEFVDMLTSTFISQNLKKKNLVAQNTVQFIENQIALTAGNLSATEGRLQSFREREKLMDIGLIGTQLVEELQELDKERSAEEVKLSYYNFLQDYVSDKRDFSEVFGPSAIGIEDPMLNSLLAELTRLHTERGRLLLNTTEKSPAVVAIDQNITQVKATLEENLKNIKAASGILMDDLNRRISRLEERITQMPSTERELIGIQRMFNITDATYNFLLEKQAEAGIALASNVPDHQIIDEARFVTIVSPMPKLNYTIGLMLGLILPLITLLVRDSLNTRIINKEQVTSAVNFPLIGIIPRHKQSTNGNDLVIFDDLFSPVAESFRNIRSNLHFFSPKKQNNLIVVTSTRSAEGKTFTAINLAAVLATSKNRTLYIDADIRKTQPNQYTKDMKEFGLSNYLIGRADLDAVINVSKYNEYLHIMNSGIKSPNPVELIESEAMTRLLKEELNDFEYIIVDTSPVGMVADAKSLMALARINLFVTRHNFSQQADLDFITEYCNTAGLKNIVLVINDVKQSQNGYGIGYGFGYGMGYSNDQESKKKKKYAFFWR